MLAFVLCVSALTPDPSSWVCSRECAGDRRMLHDGCPGCIKGLVALPQTCVPSSAVAPVRCCGDGRRCVSICVENMIPAKWTYSQAARECTARKLHVCTPNELASQRCFKTGCQLDRTQVWTSHECTRRECIANCTAAESLSVAGGVPWAPTYTFDNGVVVGRPQVTALQGLYASYSGPALHEPLEEAWFTALLSDARRGDVFVDVGVRRSRHTSNRSRTCALRDPYATRRTCDSHFPTCARARQAAIGYYCFLALRLRPELVVVAVNPGRAFREALAENAQLQSSPVQLVEASSVEEMRRNRPKPRAIVQLAVAVGFSPHDGSTVSFPTALGYGSGIIADRVSSPAALHQKPEEQATEEVALVGLEPLLEACGKDAHLVMFDIQGAEDALFADRGMLRLLRQKRMQRLFISTHSPNAHRSVVTALQMADYFIAADRPGATAGANYDRYVVAIRGDVHQASHIGYMLASSGGGVRSETRRAPEYQKLTNDGKRERAAAWRNLCIR